MKPLPLPPVSASMLKTWADCRELFRQIYLLNRKPKKPSIHQEFGIAFHKGIEVFWNGGSYDLAMAEAMAYANALDETYLTPIEREKWAEMVGYLPDLLAAYFKDVEWEPWHNVEQQWVHGLENGITVAGRLDRLHNGVLYDVKTASEIGRNWKADFRAQMLREPGPQMYDWYVCQIEQPPKMVVIEAAIKPYKSKPARIERIELPEIVSDSYRKRFDALLRFTAKEIAFWWENYYDMAPWPMSGGSICVGKYGPCPFLEICNHGETPKIMTHFIERKELVNVTYA